MAVLSTLTGKKLSIGYEVDEKKKSLALQNVKPDASNDSIYAVSQALGALINGDLTVTEVTDVNAIADVNTAE